MNKALLSYLKRNKISRLYHATYKPALKLIKQHGLGANPEGRINAWEGTSGKYVYLSYDREDAFCFAEAAENEDLPEKYLENIIVLMIDISDLDLSLLDFDENNRTEEPHKTFQYNGIIPFSLLKIT